MRRILTRLAVLGLAALLAGCGGEKTVEVGGGGSVTAGEDVSWPAADLGGLASPGGKVTGIIRTGDGVVAALTGLTKEEAAAYVERLKAEGYSASYEMQDAESYMFAGTKADGATAAFTYTYETKEASLTYVAGGEEKAQDMTDVLPWPRELLPGIPELAGKITNVIEANGTELTIELEYVKKEDFTAFLDTAKSAGYNNDPEEVRDANEHTYSARDSAGDYFAASLNFEYQTASVYWQKAQ